ncbi:hypothetical protein CH373_03135 [Leptospira perolatii]|uniref:N-acetyltransferase domain-containing protein n=1 Tax=Leptospira perolatii TaxID=2023191 RepID=A0A2M9ZSH8_9LEPT|nr:GNAT family N-acetyltransferase [Leptospira perolatii]PJZ71496.1 hypothetical protein CH360_03130 [Leptospira perolatii]PJZ75030.1 hypothetical protein CH373_03135 [Leptospira perolatii]
MPDRKKNLLPMGWRIATGKDLELLFEMEKICFPQTHWTIQNIQDHLTDKSAWVFPGLGYLLFIEIESERELLRIGILPHKRRLGEAEKALTAMCNGAKKTFLEVESSNVSARNLYAKVGLKEIGVRKSYYGPGKDAVLMEYSTE